MSEIIFRGYDSVTWVQKDFEAGDIFQMWMKTRTITASWVITVTNEDNIISVEKTVWAATTINLVAWYTGSLLIIQDWKWDAGTNNITIVPNGSETINWASSLVINWNYWQVMLIWTGAWWKSASLNPYSSISYYRNEVKTSWLKIWTGTAVTTAWWLATFYPTSDNTPSGTPIFSRMDSFPSIAENSGTTTYNTWLKTQALNQVVLNVSYTSTITILWSIQVGLIAFAPIGTTTHLTIIWI